MYSVDTCTILMVLVINLISHVVSFCSYPTNYTMMIIVTSRYLKPSLHRRPRDKALHPGLRAVKNRSRFVIMRDAYLGVGEGVEGLHPDTLVETDPNDNA